MKKIILTLILISFSITFQAQVLNIHNKNGSVLKISINNIDSISFTTKLEDISEFYNVKPNDWSCEIYESSFESLPRPQGKNGLVENPLAVVKYFNVSLGCINNKSLFLYVYDISKKESMEKIINESGIYSWCIPTFFGENEKYYIITSPCYFSNGCWTKENLKPLYQAIKGLFTKSIIVI